MLNISTRRVGGIRFLKVGRLCFSFCVTREYRNLNARKPAAIADRASQFRLSIDGELVLGFTDERTGL